MLPEVPLHRSLLFRLLLTSVVIAVCSVAATAWLAVQTTTRAVTEARGHVLSEDTDILRRLSGFAATHPRWDGVQSVVTELSRTTGRRISLTTTGGDVIADSASQGVRPSTQASAIVDPLHVDTYTSPGAQLGGIDPRAVGPYLLSDSERAQLRTLADERLACLRKQGLDGDIEETPSGRPRVNSAAEVPWQCADGKLNTPTSGELAALNELNKFFQTCLGSHDAFLSLPGSEREAYVHSKRIDEKYDEKARNCADESRRRQLGPYVAPAAELYLGDVSRSDPRFDLSTANKIKVIGVTGLILVLTIAITSVVAVRLVRPLRVLAAAAQHPADQHIRVPVTTRDETGYLAAAFNEFTARRERLEAQRKAMVSDIAHELRTPLTNIRGWLEVTRDGIVEPDPALIASLHEEALLLQRVVDDLQDLAAADAGTLKLHRELLSAGELLSHVAAAHGAQAEASGITLLQQVPDGVQLDADPVRMRQIVGNLVSNAIRHTPAGGTITLTAEQTDDHVLLTVRDTGSGIAPGDLPHIFDRFWRSEKSRSRRTGGSGLGLAIVRHLVTAHGGTVTAMSDPGVETAFTLNLPNPQRAEQHRE
ncbi:sensor histidine kinase [Streptomyces nodosus]|uniref:histidine kinase n=1 Tax=Streptomyces nodosus TaxID=40318 RepID=A0A0B5DVS7_9ACTN|nr:HAMP domain-containing sensor histidine kinase [Streptomyces nodosus]AJE44317.1 kinase [Streptomyces nodosus]MBB4795948.1 two-component system sensor histidine kinase BaeS [Streptomyces nodosus]QEV42811.1 sensor histidine kinase [Streptomyces nodosus]